MVADPEIFGELPDSKERIACLNATDSAVKQQTFLHIAAFYGHLEITQLFLSFVPLVNIEIEDWHGMTPLLLAAQKSNVPVAQEIFKAGADPEKTDKFGRSMLLFSKYPTVHTLLVESRTDRVEETAASLKWSDDLLSDMSDERDVVQAEKERSHMEWEDVYKNWVNKMRKWKSMYTRLQNGWIDTKKAHHAVEDARKILQVEVSKRNEAVARCKQVAHRTIHIIEVYHEAHVRMTIAKKIHDRLIRKRAEIRSIAASKVGIVDAMKRLAPLSLFAQSFCALALRVVTENNPVECAKVVVRGGVDALLSSMSRFPSSVVVQREGCGALANLVQLNAFAREELSKGGGIRVVFSALRFLIDSEETQRSGMRMLCGLIGALEDDGSAAAAIDEYAQKRADVKPGSREHDELERAKQLLEGAEPDKQADRNAAIQVASFATPLITSILVNFGFEERPISKRILQRRGSSNNTNGNGSNKNGVSSNNTDTTNNTILLPKQNHSMIALKMAAQALWGLTNHGLHKVVKDAIAPLCACITPLVNQLQSNNTNNNTNNTTATPWNPHPHNCASQNCLDFLRFAFGALYNISESSREMREHILSTNYEEGGLNVPEHAAHCMRSCTMWTVECWSRRDMMLSDPLAFVKGGRREGEEDPIHLALRLQQLQLNICSLMSSLTQVPDEDVRKTMVREGGFEGALYSLQYVRRATFCKKLRIGRDDYSVHTSLKAGSVRACYDLLLGVRDPITSIPHFADRKDIEPLIDALVAYPEAEPILEWTTKCFSTLGIIRKNQILLIKHGAVKAVVHAMKKQSNNPRVILHSLRALYALLGSPEGGDAAAAEGTSTLLYDILHHRRFAKHGQIRALAKEELKMVETFKYTMLEEKARNLRDEMLNIGSDMKELDGQLDEHGNPQRLMNDVPENGNEDEKFVFAGETLE